MKDVYKLGFLTAPPGTPGDRDEEAIGVMAGRGHGFRAADVISCDGGRAST